MIDLNDLSQGHHDYYHHNPLVTVGCLLLVFVLEIVHVKLITILDFLEIGSLEYLNVCIELVLHLGQGLLVIVGLVAFYWSWKERKDKKASK